MPRTVTTSARNRALMAAYETGGRIEQLAYQHGLSKKRVRAIIADEQNRRRVSREPFYCRLRVAKSERV